MKKRLLPFLITAVMVTALFSSGTVLADDWETEAISADFEDESHGEHGTGYIPVQKTLYVVDSSEDVLGGEDAADVLPSVYRSDEQPWAANKRIKDQLRTGLCWAFTMSSLAEYSFSKEYYEQTGELYNGELSPGHIGQFFYNRIMDPLENTDGDQNILTSGSYATSGGNECYGMQHLTTWSGLVPESAAPFEETNKHINSDYSWDGSVLPYSPSLAYGSNELVLEESIIVNANNRERTKQLIYEYGAATCGLYFETKYFNLDEINPETGEAYEWGHSFYNNSNSINVNHALTLIGWDDNYSKENFMREEQVAKKDADGKIEKDAEGKTVYETKTIMPKENGAWILQNSWGDEVHDHGIFYASYETKELNTVKLDIIAFDMQPADTYDYNFQYDGTAGNKDSFSKTDSGTYQPYRTTPGTRAANVYTNTTGHPISLEAVGYTTYNLGFTEYTVSVYTGLTDPNDPMSGTFDGSSVISSTLPGCKTGKLDQPVIIKPGETYSIVFEFTNFTAFGTEEYQDVDWLIFDPALDPGQSFFKPAKSTSSWEDMYSYESCFRIKGFANACTYDLTGAEVLLSDTEYTYDKETQKPEILYIGGMQLAEGIDYTAEWSDAASKDAGIYSVFINGTGEYTGMTEGSYEIGKADNPLSVTGKTASVTYVPSTGKDQTIAASKVFTVINNQGKVTYKKTDGSSKILVASDGKVTVKKGLGVGTYTVKADVTAAGDDNYQAGTEAASIKISVKKAANTMTAKGKNASVSYDALSKKNQTLAASKVISVSSKQGKVTYKKASGNAKILIASNGKVTVKKGLKKGTYTVKAKVHAAGNGNYKPVTKTVSFKITVK